MPRLYTSGEVAEILGIDVRKVRYFAEQKIIIPSQFRQEGKKSTRLFTNVDIVKFRQLLLYQELGYSNPEIKRLLNSPDFSWRKAVGDQIEALKAKKKHIENSLVVLEIMRSSSSDNDSDLPFDISDFDNSIDQFVSSAFIPDEMDTPAQGFREMSSDIADSLSISEKNKQGEIIISMLFGLRNALEDDPGSKDVQDKLSDIFAYLRSASDYTVFDPKDILFGLRLVSTLSLEMVMDMFLARQGATELLLEALQIYSERIKEDKDNG